MKKIILKIIITCFIFGMFVVIGRDNASAEEVQAIRSGDYEYRILNDKDKLAALTKINNYGEEVIIPDTIDGYRIIWLGISDEFTAPALNLSIFAESDGIVKKLVIPEGVTRIENGAFNEMNVLEELYLPKTLAAIRPGNFKNTTHLKNVQLLNGISIGNECFKNAEFDEMVLTGSLSGYDDDHYGYMGGTAKRVKINADKAVIEFGNAKAKEFVIGKKVKNITLGPGSYGNIVLSNPKTTLTFFSGDECDVKKLTTVITDDVKCKKKSGKYIYSWNPVKIKGKKYTAKYEISCKNSKGKYKKIKTQKKTQIKSDKKVKLRIKVTVQLPEGRLWSS